MRWFKYIEWMVRPPVNSIILMTHKPYTWVTNPQWQHIQIHFSDIFSRHGQNIKASWRPIIWKEVAFKFSTQKEQTIFPDTSDIAQQLLINNSKFCSRKETACKIVDTYLSVIGWSSAAYIVFPPLTITVLFSWWDLSDSICASIYGIA